MKLPFNKQDKDFYQRRASLLKSVGDPNCLKILNVLVKEDNPCVSDITKNLKIQISAVSHQLSKLKALGIVETERSGQTICYRMAKGKDAEFVKSLLN